MSSSPTLLQAAPLVARLGLKSGQVVGDFGAGGSGHVAAELSQAVGGNGTVLLFDVQKNALSAAISNLQMRGVRNVQSVWTDLEVYQAASGIQDASIDAGVMVNVLHQSKHPKAILAEVGRMLKVGARLVVVDWLTDQSSPLAPPLAMRLGLEHVAQVAQSIGYAKLEEFSAGPYHWGLVIVKT